MSNVTAHQHKGTSPTVNRGGGHILLRGCFFAAGSGRLKGNATEYREILQDRLIVPENRTACSFQRESNHSVPFTRKSLSAQS